MVTIQNGHNLCIWPGCQFLFSAQKRNEVLFRMLKPQGTGMPVLLSSGMPVPSTTVKLLNHCLCMAVNHHLLKGNWQKLNNSEKMRRLLHPKINMTWPKNDDNHTHKLKITCFSKWNLKSFLNINRCITTNVALENQSLIYLQTDGMLLFCKYLEFIQN